ncbi:MAG: CHAT domain-containing protein [Planctomycetes bacterium]|nr:CHAT domain-containing protein [Planctomycetota bacterium]
MMSTTAVLPKILLARPARRSLAAVLLATVFCSPAMAQRPQRRIPNQLYQASFRDFHDGDFGDALKEFKAASRGAIRTTRSRWIDSICYHTMQGECYYHMGKPAEALEHYTAAVKLHDAFSGWMIRVSFPKTLRPDTNRARRAVVLAPGRRRFAYVHVPQRMSVSQGDLNVNAAIRRGGAVQQAVLMPIDVTEVVRCTTLAIRRRAQLMGPVCKYDPLTESLIAKLELRPAPPGNWSQSWIDVQLGLAYAAGGRTADAAKWLKRGIFTGGQYVHPLTPIAQLELGKIALASGDFDSAGALMADAINTAAAYRQYGLLEEALRWGQRAHVMANRQGDYPPLAAAATWGRTRSKHLQASALLSLAEIYSVAGRPKQALALLTGDARKAIGNRNKSNMGAGNIGGRLDYLTAQVQYQLGQTRAADAATAAALAFIRKSSLRMFQIALADREIKAGHIRLRAAMDLYAEVLRDPTAADWNSDPSEALAVLITPHEAAYQGWFTAAVLRKDFAKAHEIADLARRHRFYSSLPMGGRALSLRWILEAPPERLGEKGRLQRQKILNDYPHYKKLATQSAAVRQALDKLPMVVDDPAERKEQVALLADLAKLGRQKELILREMALRREPAELVFPPHRTTKEIQDSLPKGRALWSFYQIGGQLHSFMMSNGKYLHWRISAPAARRIEKLSELLRAMGNFNQNHQLTLEQLKDDSWKEPAKELTELLLTGAVAGRRVTPKVLGDTFDEIVIVPDGILWYLPFEALQVPGGDSTVSLISKTRVRYAPTTGLALSYGEPRKLSSKTAIVVGRLHPKDDEDASAAAIDRLRRAVVGTTMIEAPLPALSPLFATLTDQLLVLDEIDTSNKGPYDWSPIQLDKVKTAGTLGRWFSLPWGAPDVVLLPGYRTAAEFGLRRGRDRAPNGHEIFLSLCGMMSTGTRTILLGRWRTGGQTSSDLMREFLQELPQTPAAEAWQRSVELATETKIKPDVEPRVKPGEAAAPTASHPLFWAGYMLIDSAPPPAQDAAGAAEKRD